MDAISAKDATRTRSFPLWFGLLGPPLAWGTHLVLGDLIFELGCGPGMRSREILGSPLEVWALIQTSLLSAVIVAAGLFAFSAWRRLRKLENGVRLDRARAMAVAGIASSLIYLLITAFGFVPSFFLNSCVTSP